MEGVVDQQEKEALLNHLLQLERERRIQAEQQVEAEKQACLELRHLLLRERKIHMVYPSSPSQLTLVLPPEEKIGNEVGEEEPATTAERKKEDTGPTVPRDESLMSLDSLSLFGDFSSAVFNQLPSDLQKMFGVAADIPRPKSTLMGALEAVKADDPEHLQQCIVKLEEGTICGNEGQNLLDVACERGHTGCVRVLLNAGCTPNSSFREDGMTAVHLAARNGHAASLQLLVDIGGNMNHQDLEGQTPLFLALCEGRKECIERLMEANSSLQAVTKSGYTPLHAAVSGRLPDALRMLLVYLRTSMEGVEVSCVVNHRNKDGSTALHLAASRGYKRCVEVLSSCHEVDLSLRDRWNRTALDISTEDCRGLLQNKESKEVTVFVEQSLQQTNDSIHPPAVAIGRLAILRHHKLPDVELLIDSALRQYCHALRGHRPDPPRESKSPTPDSEEENGPVTLSEILGKKLYREHGSKTPSGILRDSYHRLSRMDLSGSSVSSYRIGQIQWNRGELPKSVKSKNLFSLFGERRSSVTRLGKGGKSLQMFIFLKGASERHLDQLAFELMIPVATLREYVDLVEKGKALMLHGPQGSGKTLLAKNLAECLKHELGRDRTQIIHVSLHPSFQRDDLFRLLHLNGLLVHFETGVPASEGMESQTGDGRGTCRPQGQMTSSLRPKFHIVILDDTDRVSTASILAELLTAMEYHGPTNPLWIDAVYGRDGVMLYPAGYYYLKRKCYFIATRTQASGDGLQSPVLDQFTHVYLGVTDEPSSGVVYRQLMARLIHAREGCVPHRSDQLYKAVQWVWNVWLLYNHYMCKWDLQELTMGLRHFVQCPLESSTPDEVFSWLCGVWNHHVAPRIEDALHNRKKLEGEHRYETVANLLTAITQRVLRATCPLDPEGTVQLMEKFRGGPDDAVADSVQRKSEDPSPPPLRTVNSHASLPPEHKPPSSASSSMVAYEDMARNSPRVNAKPPPSSKAVRFLGQADSRSLDGVQLKQDSGKNSTLRKLRSKAASLFSKDKIGSTLPRLFRRGSRTSLSSVPSMVQNRTNIRQAPSSKDLDDLFDILSTTSSERYDDQRSPGPKSLVSSPISNSLVSSPLSNSLVSSPLSNPIITSQIPLKDPDTMMNVLPTSTPDKSCSPFPGLRNPSSPPSHQSMPDLLADTNPLSPQRALVVKVDIPPKSHSISNMLDQVVQSEKQPKARCRDGHREMTKPLFQPSTEPVKRRILSPTDNEKAASAAPTPAFLHKTSPLATNGMQNGRDLPPKYQNQTRQRAKSTDGVLSNGYEMDMDLSRATSEGDVLQQSTVEGSWLQNGSEGSLEYGSAESLENGVNASTPTGVPSENGLKRCSNPGSQTEELVCTYGDSASSDCKNSIDRRTSIERRDSVMSDTSAMSSNLLFSATLGFLSPDSPIMSKSSSQSKDLPRLSTQRPSITLMDILTDEDLDEM